MKKVLNAIAVTVILLFSTGCGNNEKKADAASAETGNVEPAKQADKMLNNAGNAKRPNGTLTLKIDGESFAAGENTVQCMFIGMGSKEMAQGLISAKGDGFSVSATMMTKPEAGEVKSKGTAPTVGFALIKDGIQYNSMPGGNLKIIITSVNPDGNNYYIGGTFSGTLKAQDGKTITITDGRFKSAYL